ncbi:MULTISPECIES: VOC family protein [unclassified Streptomyces]|uniref:VOC family protein n=1 Tax=unclassified Streptomyces TaxID=2593676 RepID=UPI000C2780A2|nr:VOC family protein [Streptomyces sp. CB01373]PJM93260.1 glyoxalase [Streptomyces sp. CB01373]
MNRDDLPAPVEGLVLTHFFTVSDVPRSRAFYADVLGGTVVLEENPCIIKIANGWIILNPGGGPTDDKPDVVLRTPDDPRTASSFLNVRVADIHRFCEAAAAKGAEFLTPPVDRRAELRCYMRDPDGYLIEVGQATGLLKGELARTDI